MSSRNRSIYWRVCRKAFKVTNLAYTSRICRHHDGHGYKPNLVSEAGPAKTQGQTFIQTFFAPLFFIKIGDPLRTRVKEVWNPGFSCGTRFSRSSQRRQNKAAMFLARQKTLSFVCNSRWISHLTFVSLSDTRAWCRMDNRQRISARIGRMWP